MTTTFTSCWGRPLPLLPILTTTTAPIWRWGQKPLKKPILVVVTILVTEVPPTGADPLPAVLSVVSAQANGEVPVLEGTAIVKLANPIDHH